MKKAGQMPPLSPGGLRVPSGPRPAPEALAATPRCPGTFRAGTQIRSASDGPGGDTGRILGKMAAAVAGPRGCGAAVGEEVDSGNRRRFPDGSGKGWEREGVWVPLCSDGLLRPPRPPPWAASGSSLPRPSPSVGPSPSYLPSGAWAGGGSRLARGGGR